MQHEDNAYDLPENKQVPIWFLGIMVSGYATSLFGWRIFWLGMALTSIVSLIVLYKQKKPTEAATSMSKSSKNLDKTLTHIITESELKSK